MQACVVVVVVSSWYSVHKLMSINWTVLSSHCRSYSISAHNVMAQFEI